MSKSVKIISGDRIIVDLADRWLSVEEISAHLGVSCDTIYRWIEHNNLPAYKIGRLWKFKKDTVDKWVEAGGASSIPPKIDSNRGPK